MTLCVHRPNWPATNISNLSLASTLHLPAWLLCITAKTGETSKAQIQQLRERFASIHVQFVGETRLSLSTFERTKHPSLWITHPGTMLLKCTTYSFLFLEAQDMTIMEDVCFSSRPIWQSLNTAQTWSACTVVLARDSSLSRPLRWRLDTRKLDGEN